MPCAVCPSFDTKCHICSIICCNKCSFARVCHGCYVYNTITSLKGNKALVRAHIALMRAHFALAYADRHQPIEISMLLAGPSAAKRLYDELELPRKRAAPLSDQPTTDEPAHSD